MNLYMTITNDTIFQEVQHSFYNFSNVHIQYLSLQQIDSQQSEDDNYAMCRLSHFRLLRQDTTDRMA